MAILTTIGIITTLFAVLGYAIDKFILNKKKKDLHLNLTRWWFHLEESKFRKLPEEGARKILIAGKRVFKWKIISWKSIVLFVIISCLLTSITSIVSLFLDRRENVGLPPLTIYISNFPFDTLTTLVTLAVLRIVSKGKLFISIFSILSDIVIAYFFASLCAAFMGWSTDMIDPFLHKKFSGGQDVEYEILPDRIKTMLTDDGFSEQVSLFYIRKFSLHYGLSYYSRNAKTLLSEGSGVFLIDKRAEYGSLIAIEGQMEKKYKERFRAMSAWGGVGTVNNIYSNINIYAIFFSAIIGKIAYPRLFVLA